MQIKMLSAFDVPQNIIELWEQSYGEELLPIQERAVKEYKLLQGTNLVVFAPTSSGKTFIGEIAAVGAVFKKKKVFYLVPMKALAEEKYMEFREKYLPVGVKTVISTRDHQEYDMDILQGSYDMAILVFEKLNALLVNKPSLLEEVGLIVVDELQMIGDEERGAPLELLLTKVLQTKTKPQILGLSAVLGEAKDLAAWLSAELLMEDKRPVELRKGVFFNDTFYYLEHNSRHEDEEKWEKCEGANREDMMLSLSKYLSETRGESTILFLPDKPTVERFARRLRESVHLEPVEEAIVELSHLEESALRDMLMFLLKKGVALHHGDLSWDLRDVIERHARAGRIKLLVSTTTLGVGINMPFKNAILDERRWKTFKRPKDIRLTDKTKSQLENESGRVARFGFIPDFGRAILVTDLAAHKDIWMRYYMKGAFEPICATMDKEDMQEILLNFIASDLAHTKEELKALLRSTYTANHAWKLTDADYETLLQNALNECEESSLLISNGKGTFVASDLGKLCSQKGIKVNTALWFVTWMQETDADKLSELEVLLAAALTQDGQDIMAPFRRWDYDKKRDYYRSLFHKSICERSEETKCLYSLLRTQRFLDYAEVKAMKEALFLSEWVTNLETCEMEQKYFAASGAIQKTAQEFSWLIETLSQMCELKGWRKGIVAKLRELSQRLIYGVTEKGLALSKIRVPGFSRGYIARLVREGYDSVEALKEVTEFSEYARLLPESIARRLYAHVHARAVSQEKEEEEEKAVMLKAAEVASAYVAKKEETKSEIKDAEAVSSAPPQDTDSRTLVVNLNRCKAFYKGFDLALPRRAFDFLAYLSEKPMHLINRNELCKKVFPGEEVFPSDERIKMNNLKYACIRKLKRLKKKHATMRKEPVQEVILTMHGRGYLLNLPEGEVGIVR